MTRAIRGFRGALLALFLGGIVSGCAGGGESGTGFTTTEGNVSSIGGQARREHRAAPRATWLAGLRSLLPFGAVAIADGGLAGIEVSIPGTFARSTTNARGEFFLRGTYRERVAVLFERASDRLSARLFVRIPRGASLLLRDVHIDRGSGVAEAEVREISFEGVVALADCSRDRLFAYSRFDRTGRPFEIDTGDTVVLDEDGAVIACRDLRPGDRIDVHALVQDDETFGMGAIQRTDR